MYGLIQLCKSNRYSSVASNGEKVMKAGLDKHKGWLHDIGSEEINAWGAKTGLKSNKCKWCWDITNAFSIWVTILKHRYEFDI